MLRWAVLAYGVIQLGVAVVLFAVVHLPLWSVLYLVVNAAVTIAALTFERRRYRPAVDRGPGEWQATDERFVDTTTGQVMEVRYNPETGQRDYVTRHEG